MKNMKKIISLIFLLFVGLNSNIFGTPRVIDENAPPQSGDDLRPPAKRARTDRLSDRKRELGAQDSSVVKVARLEDAFKKLTFDQELAARKTAREVRGESLFRSLRRTRAQRAIINQVRPISKSSILVYQDTFSFLPEEVVGSIQCNNYSEIPWDSYFYFNPDQAFGELNTFLIKLEGTLVEDGGCFTPSRGGEIHARDGKDILPLVKTTILHEAASAGDITLLQSIISFLKDQLKQKYSDLTDPAQRKKLEQEYLGLINSKDYSFGYGVGGQTPLHLAKTVEMVQFLLANGANIRAEDINKMTPSKYAQLTGRAEIALFLNNLEIKKQEEMRKRIMLDHRKFR